MNKKLLSNDLNQEYNSNEKHLIQLALNSGDWLWQVDSEGLYTYASSNIFSTLGYYPDEVIGKKHFYDLFIPDTKEELKKAVFDVFKKKESFHSFKNSNLHKNGHTVVLETNGFPILDENGRLTGYQGIDRNITEREMENQALELIANQFSAISSVEFHENACRYLTKTLDVDIAFVGKLINDNNTVEVISGVEQGKRIDSFQYELEDTPCKIVMEGDICFYPSNIQNLFPKDALLIEMGIESYVGIPIKNREGEVIGIALLLSRKPLKEKDRYTNLLNIFSSRISAEMERMQLEFRLEKAKEKAEGSKNYLDNIINGMGDPVFVKDDQSRLLLVNDAFCTIFNLSREEIIGKTLVEEVTQAEQESFLRIDNQVLLDGKENIQEESLTVRGSKKLIISTRKTRIIDEKGEKFLIGVIRDISELKSVERKLFEAKEKAVESDQLKTEFLNNMSHEIRTPMNGIIGFSGLLDDNDISDEKRKNFIRIIQSSGQQLLNVIDDILEISILGTKQVKVIDSDVCLNDLMLELFSTFDLKAKEQKNPLYLKKALSDKQSTIRTDSTKLNKVLSNLLENALKFTSVGFIEFGYQFKNKEIELYVKDTGIGIEKSKHELIFERFSQAEKDLSKNIGGLGLGLSIAKENTELLGGRIRVESKEGEGATFFVSIPYKPVYKFTNIEKAKTEPKYTVLIAEDEEINYLYIETLLKDVFGLDCLIIHVTNGKDAFEACKENKTIDLVLMDLKMPVMNGFEATKLIKKLHPNLSIIAQTAYSTPQDKEKAISVGCDFFISKPIQQKSFKNILDKYLIKN